MTNQNESKQRMLRATHLADRYNVTDRTIFRWRKTGVLPEPDLIIHGQPYWTEENIEHNERTHLSPQGQTSSAA